MPRKRKTEEVPETMAKKAKKDDSTLKFDLEWKEEGNSKAGLPLMIYLDGPGASHSSKVVGFDIDWTVIKTKSGKKFPTGPSDWTFLFDCVPKKLQSLQKEGKKIVFFSNQAGIEKGKQDVKSLLKKFEDIIDAIGIPIQVFICTGNSHYRKPSTTMWKFLESKCNGGVKIDAKESMFVGDAAGRPKNWSPGKSKDFSATDRMFAANCSVSFATPEAFFLGEPEAKFSWGSLDVKKFVDGCSALKPYDQLHSNSPEVVVLVGRPASGKSTLRKRFFEPHDYITVNRDTLGTKEKCIKVAGAALAKGESVIVDNTNPSKAVRQAYINLARKHKVPCRCLYLPVSPELSAHLNMYRQTQSLGEQRRVPEVGYRVFEKEFELPSADEGFSEVRSIDFVPVFDSKSDEELFQQWTSML